MSRVSTMVRPDTLRRWAGGPGRPLLSPRLRWPAAILAVACAIIAAVLGAAFAGQAKPGGLDRVVDQRLISALLRYGSVLRPVAYNTPIVVIGLGVLAFCCCLLTRRPRVAALLAIALPAGLLADQLLKPLVHRTMTGFLSYPSGHTIGAFSLAVPALIVLLGPQRPPLRRAVRVLLACAVLAIACLVPVALISQHMHYFTDTVGGAALATALVLAAALLIDAIGPGTRRAMLGKEHDRTDSA
jgi:membrane-associated phospholipid phosphatase